MSVQPNEVHMYHLRILSSSIISSFLFVFIATCTILFSTCQVSHGLKQLNGGGYYCHVLCLADRLSRGQDQSLDVAKENCAKYDRNDFCNSNTSSSCSKHCPDLQAAPGGGSSDSIAAPGNVRANYSSEPVNNPYVIHLEWDKVPSAILYVVEYFQVGDNNGESEKILGHEENVDVKVLVNRSRDSLCIRYGFRVASVDHQRAISSFSNDVVLEKPVPVFVLSSRPVYKLKSLTYTNKMYTADSSLGDDASSTSDPHTVEAVIEYSLPPNWRSNDFVAPSDEYVHNLMCKRPGVGPFTVRSNMSSEKPELVVPFPGKSVESDCTYLYTLFGLTTVCGTQALFPDPAEGNQSADMGLFVNISCSSVKNAPCNNTEENKEPSCAVKDFQYEVSTRNAASASVTVRWGDVLNQKSWPIRYYLVKYSLSEKPTSDQLVLVVPVKKSLGTLKACGADPTACSGITGDASTRTATIQNLDMGEYFVAQVCAIYEPSLEYSIQWDTVARYPIDLTASNDSSSSSSSSTPFDRVTSGSSSNISPTSPSTINTTTLAVTAEDTAATSPTTIFITSSRPLVTTTTSKASRLLSGFFGCATAGVLLIQCINDAVVGVVILFWYML